MVKIDNIIISNFDDNEQYSRIISSRNYSIMMFKTELIIILISHDFFNLINSVFIIQLEQCIQCILHLTKFEYSC